MKDKKVSGSPRSRAAVGMPKTKWGRDRILGTLKVGGDEPKRVKPLALSDGVSAELKATFKYCNRLTIHLNELNTAGALKVDELQNIQQKLFLFDVNNDQGSIEDRSLMFEALDLLVQAIDRCLANSDFQLAKPYLLAAKQHYISLLQSIQSLYLDESRQVQVRLGFVKKPVQPEDIKTNGRLSESILNQYLIDPGFIVVYLDFQKELTQVEEGQKPPLDFNWDLAEELGSSNVIQSLKKMSAQQTWIMRKAVIDLKHQIDKVITEKYHGHTLTPFHNEGVLKTLDDILTEIEKG